MLRLYGDYTLSYSPVICIGGQVVCNSIPVREAVTVCNLVTMAHKSADNARENSVVAIMGFWEHSLGVGSVQVRRVRY